MSKTDGHLQDKLKYLIVSLPGRWMCLKTSGVINACFEEASVMSRWPTGRRLDNMDSYLLFVDFIVWADVPSGHVFCEMV